MAIVLMFAGRLMAAIPADNSNGSVVPAGIQVKFDTATSPQEVSQSLKIFLLMTALSLAPSALVMMTSFTRILIVLGIMRQALGLQNVPPGQILAGMALFLTMFTMAPVWEKINQDAIQPYMAEEISQQEAWDKGLSPLKAFMLKQTGDSELNLFMEISGNKAAANRDDIPLVVVIPAFMASELKTALQMAFLVYLPFLIVDLVVASSLMALGMMMLPPMMVSLPVKLLLFVLADG
ncbi:MAG: flagellar type III secretion system pore protein FliP, partial [Lentisphaerae bacterium]|nr:flagellar type III secretion system pore protein FliP [Lentisphaerota bacterium]